MAFKDKNELEAGDREDEFRTGAFPLESADMESPDEESPDDDEETELSEEELAAEVEEFNRAEEVPEFPDDEDVEKIPDLKRSRWLARILSCVTGAGFGVVIAGLLVNSVPAPQQARMFLIYFLVLAPLFSIVGHWVFVLHPQRMAKKMDEESAHAIGSEPIHPK